MMVDGIQRQGQGCGKRKAVRARREAEILQIFVALPEAQEQVARGLLDCRRWAPLVVVAAPPGLGARQAARAKSGGGARVFHTPSGQPGVSGKVFGRRAQPGVFLETLDQEVLAVARGACRQRRRVVGHDAKQRRERREVRVRRQPREDFDNGAAATARNTQQSRGSHQNSTEVPRIQTVPKPYLHTSHADEGEDVISISSGAHQ